MEALSLAEVIGRILDKETVVDLWARASLAEFELLAVKARIVIASIEPQLYYAMRLNCLQ